MNLSAHPRPRHCIATLAFLLLTLTARPQQPDTPQTIHVNVQRVNVGVVATDPRGRFVEGLTREDFQVFDNGASQPITEFAAVDEPAQIVLLIEAGPAVYFLQDAHIFAADALLTGLSPSDRVAIARYDADASPLLAFTRDKAAAQSTLSAIRFNLGFGQLNLSTSLNTVLDWLEPAAGKKTIVLLSTGVDTSPAAEVKKLQSRLQTGDVPVLCVSVTGPMRNGKKGTPRQLQQMQGAFEQADANLRSVAEASSGRAYFPESAKAIQAIYAQVAELVRNEYSLAFAPPAEDGKVHAIEVKINLSELADKSKSPGYRIDHRKAYTAPPPPPQPQQ